MKKLVLLFCFFALNIGHQVQAQLAFQFADVSRDGASLSNIPRFSWMIPLSYEINQVSESFLINGGVLLKNDGVIFEENGDRFKYRVISIGPEIGFFVNLGESSLVLSGDYGFDFALHYKEKVFPNGERSDKRILTREWFSDRPNRLNHYVRVGVGTENGLYMFGQFYFRDFLNNDFQETIDGVAVQPYKDLVIQRFHLGISFKFVKGTNFKLDWTRE
jgi:hypothetical protein